MRDRIFFPRLRAATGGILCALVLAGCNNLLKVKDPDVASPGTVAGADKLNTQLAGLLGDFDVGYDGASNSEGLVNLTGLMTDEFSFTETFPTRIVIDQRNMTRSNVTLTPIFFNIERARASAERVQAAYQQYDPTNANYAQALNLGGFAEVMMAETYCSGVPLSDLNPDGTLSNNTPLTTAQVLTDAVSLFDQAIPIANAAGNAEFEDMARVGKARALLDLGRSNLQEADTVVAGVPTSFQYLIQHSSNTGREYNGEWEYMWNQGRWSVADSEGTNGLPFRSANDPRVPYTYLGRGFASGTQLWGPNVYDARESPTVLTSGIEARLIQAEAALDRADYVTWLADLNALRSGSGLALAPLIDPGTDTARVSLTFYERAFWLYGTGHRLGDMRRLSRAVANGGYGRDPETVFPSGTYIYRGQADGVYGTDVNFPIPIEEGNNPLSQGCIDRNP